MPDAYAGQLAADVEECLEAEGNGGRQYEGSRAPVTL
jgi:hypothetical protein